VVGGLPVAATRPSDLIARAERANPDIAAAQAALRQAHELYLAERGSLLPAVDGALTADRSRFATGSISNPTISPTATYSLYTAQLTLTYAVDVFGLNRRSIESARAQEEASRFQLEAAYLTLSSNVVVTAIQEASLRGQLEATQRLRELQHHLTETVRSQQDLGVASHLDILMQETLEAQTAATLPPLQKQLAQTRDQLTALLGRLPSEEPAETFRLAAMSLPRDLPVSLPSRLIEQRPDVREAEANLHAASAQVGVAIASMLPQFTITADSGSSALTAGQLFRTGNGFWDVGATLTQTLFAGGTLWHRKRAADAALDAAGAHYRAAVIAACKEVADTLHALAADAEALNAALVAERNAAQALQLARQQRELGSISAVAVLAAEQSDLQAGLALVQAQASRYADTAALFQSVGGGWWNRSMENEQ
jgi:NodT family efflux transporter outer membrane factor (OMF) lipoprotein